MATFEELKEQAVNAYLAGDKATAERLTAQAKAMQAAPQEQPAPQASGSPDLREQAIQAQLAGDTKRAQWLADAYKAGLAELPAPSAAAAMVEGPTFGFSDELAGGMGYLENLIHGRDPKKGYEEWRTRQRLMREQFAAEHPKTATGLEVAGAAVTGGAGLLRGGARVLGRQALNQGLRGAAARAMLRSPNAQRAVVGAGMGALSGAGHTEGGLEERMRGAGLGAAGGAFLGVAAPAVAGQVGRGLAGVAQRIPGMSNTQAASAQALELVEQAASRKIGFGAQQGVRQTKQAVREALKGLNMRERAAFQKTALERAEALAKDPDLTPAQLRDLTSVARSVVGGGAAGRAVQRGIREIAKSGQRTTSKPKISARVLDAGLRLGQMVTPNAGMTGMALGAARSALARPPPGMALPMPPAPRPPPEVLGALMGFSSPQAGMILGGGQ